MAGKIEEDNESEDAVSDMQMSESDADMDRDSDQEQDLNAKMLDVDEPVDIDDDDDEEEEEPEEEAEDVSDLEDLSPPSSPPPEPRPRLKITLKLPAHTGSTSNVASTGTSTPAALDGPSRDIDIESEDEDEQDGERAGSTPSTSMTGPSGRPMTTRQAVLASVVDSSHVSLNESARKKKHLNEAEIALRREETARKRKNLSEKKLEDEKAETINRLLKKQSRPKNKRSALATADDRTAPATPPVPATEGTGDIEEPNILEPMAVEVVPTMYRWLSTARPAPEQSMSLSFSVPIHVLPGEDEVLPPPPLPAVQIALCDMDGCTQARRYRLVRDWTRGACGMGHLKALESLLVS